MQIVSISTLNISMFDSVESFTMSAAPSVAIANIYDKIFLVLLSFFLKIGKLIVSAGA